MRVLHMIRVVAVAGAEKLLTQLLPALSDKTSLTLVILHEGEPTSDALQISQDLKAEGIDVRMMKYRSLFSFRLHQKVASFIHAGKFDLVHSHLKHADLLMALVRFRRLTRIPIVTTVHGYRDEYENRFGFQITRQLYFSYYYWLSRFIYARFDGFILISHIIEKFVTSAGLIPQKQRRVIYHGYTYTGLPAGPETDPSIFRLAIPGRLIRRKGQWIAIEALRILQESAHSFELHLYGDGTDRAILQEQAANAGVAGRVRFHGYVSDVRQRLRQADIILLPSVWEGFGIVFLDAFSVQRPVIALDLPAANEIIQHERNGLLVKGADPAGLAKEILRLYDQPELRVSLAGEALQDLQTRFPMSLMVSNYYSFYQSVSGHVEIH